MEDKKAKILNDSDDQLLKAIEGTQNELLKFIKSIINKLDTKKGEITNSENNRNLVNQLKKKIFDQLNKTGYPDAVSKYLVDFDKLEDINKQMYEAQGIEFSKSFTSELSREKREIVEDITKALTNKPSFDANFSNEVKSNFQQAIRRGWTADNLAAALTTYIAQTNTVGHLQRYVGQIARDALNRYDGRVNGIIIQEYEMPYFKFVNNKVGDTRQNCQEMVDRTGALGELAVKKKVFRVEDVPKIIAIASKRPGWDDSTTVDNYFEKRNGYNCRHFIIGLNKI